MYAGAGTAASPLSAVYDWPAAGNMDLYYVTPSGQVAYQHNGGSWGAVTTVSMP